MYTTSICSEKPPVKTSIYIKGDFNKLRSPKNGGQSSLEKEKAIVRDILQSPATQKSITGKFAYTIQKGDDKRLSRDGVLKVYNINEPIDIPVGKLLGNWKKSHIGVTLVVLNNQWCVEGEVFEGRIYKRERGVLVALRLMLESVMA